YPEIGDHQVKCLFSNRFDPFRTGRYRSDIAADSLQCIHHGKAHQGLIVDQQNGQSFHASFSAKVRSRDTGRHRVKVVPFPASLSTKMFPPCRSMMPRLTESPSPVPSPSPLVVKKGSKTRGRTDAGMPDPVSFTSTRQTPSATDVLSVNTPPFFMACTAFKIKFIKTCSIIWRSTMTLGKPLPGNVSKRIRLGTKRWAVSPSTWSTIRLISAGLNAGSCCCEKSSNCRTIF